jgi:hypothetical protein
MPDDLEYGDASGGVICVFHRIAYAVGANDIRHVTERLGIARDFTLKEIG